MANETTHSQNEAAWALIRRRVEEIVATNDRLRLAPGRFSNIVKVEEPDSARKELNAICFELFMDTGGLRLWFEEGLIRWDQLNSQIISEGDSLRVRFQGDSITIEEMVDRAFEQWLAKKWKIRK